MLQGNLAPDLFGIRNRRSADYTQEGPIEIEECFIDPSEIEIKYERRLISNRLREYDSQSCYDDVIITGISEDLMQDNGNKSAKLEIREQRQSSSAFQEEPIYKAFPSLNSRPVTDRWSWLNYPQRDDGMCVATLPGKYNITSLSVLIFVGIFFINLENVFRKFILITQYLQVFPENIVSSHVILSFTWFVKEEILVIHVHRHPS